MQKSTLFAKRAKHLVISSWKDVPCTVAVSHVLCVWVHSIGVAAQNSIMQLPEKMQLVLVLMMISYTGRFLYQTIRDLCQSDIWWMIHRIVHSNYGGTTVRKLDIEDILRGID